MDSNALTLIIDEVTATRGLLLQPTLCRSSKYVGEFIYEIPERGTIYIAVPTGFPLQIPDIFVNDPSEKLLHIDSKDKLCLLDKSSLLIDTDRPAQIIIDCIDQAIKILSIKPGTEEYYIELQQEFLSYWGHDCDWNLISILDTDQVVFGEYPVLMSNSCFLLANTENEANVFYHNTLNKTNAKDLQYAKALVIKMRDGTLVPSPFVNYNWANVRRYIMANTTSSTKRQFEKYLKKKYKTKTIIIVLILPAPHGDILFSFMCKFKNTQYIPLKTSISQDVTQMDLVRMDYDYLLNRGGAVPSLKDKRVLLLGCGSVGGYIASNLCQLGIRYLDLLDSDILLPHNIHRHILGFDSLNNKSGLNKADLLKNMLEGQYPYVDIDALNYIERTAEAFLSNPNRLASYDVIISALGEPSINLMISRLLHENEIKTSLVVCFNEPYGIGGHIIIDNISSDSCLRCLYSDPHSGDLVSFRGSLVESAQNFQKTLSGCSGMYVPYSSLDSQQTANYALRKILDIFNRQLKTNQLYSWKGDSAVLIGAGFRVSPVYDAFEYVRALNVLQNDNCPECQRRVSK